MRKERLLAQVNGYINVVTVKWDLLPGVGYVIDNAH